MSLWELFIIAVGLSMDAFAVSVCKGLSVSKVSPGHAVYAGLWFGGFQFLMPTLGFFLGDRFAVVLTKFGPWVAFVLLSFIGGNMLKEGFSKDTETTDSSFGVSAMAVLAVATSIDALAVGITFALLPNVNIIAAVCFIGAITFIISGAGLKVEMFSV